MRILFLDAYFEPEQIAFTHLENDLLKGLVNAGHEIEIICPIPTRGVSKEVVKEYRKKTTEVLYDGKVHVNRFYAPQEGKNPVIRAIRYLLCNIQTYRLAKAKKKVDTVFANSTPPTQGWIAGKIAEKLGVPFIYSLQDIFPDSLINAGMARKGSFIWRLGKKIEDQTYRKASVIITISDGFKQNLLNKGVPESKIVVIPNWVDISEIYSVKRGDNKIIKKYGLDQNRFYISYCGNVGHSQNLELLIDVAKEIEKRTDQIEFVIIGEGAAKNVLNQMIVENNLKNIHLLSFQPYEDIAHVFSLGDVGLIISKSGIGNSSVPSKTWSIMAAHRPVLASFDKGGELDRVINRIGCGVLVDADDKNALIKAIIEMYSEKDRLKTMVENGYKYVSEVVCKKVCVQKYIQTFENRKLV